MKRYERMAKQEEKGSSDATVIQILRAHVCFAANQGSELCLINCAKLHVCTIRISVSYRVIMLLLNKSHYVYY